MEFEDLVCPHCNKKGIPLNAFDGVYWCNCGCKWTSRQQALIDEAVAVLEKYADPDNWEKVETGLGELDAWYMDRGPMRGPDLAEKWLKKARGE